MKTTEESSFGPDFVQISDAEMMHYIRKGGYLIMQQHRHDAWCMKMKDYSKACNCNVVVGNWLDTKSGPTQ